MEVKALKIPNKRFSTDDNTSLGIQNWGDNNLYPLEISRIVRSSSTASECLDRYIKFIFGEGISDQSLAEKIVNDKGEMLNSVAEKGCEDRGEQGGFAFHVNYDIFGRLNEISHIPIENCRLCMCDENGFVDRIGVFPDWSGAKKYGGKAKKATKDSITWLTLFNPEKFYEELGENGLEEYPGQILYFSNRGNGTYPMAKFDPALTEISTDEGLANISYRTVRNGFYPSGAFVIKKGLTSPDEPELTPGRIDESSIEYKLEQLQGDQNMNKMLVLKTPYPDELFEFIPFGGQNYDKEFDVTNRNIVERIYAAFEQEGFYRMRSGSVGFGSDVIAPVYEYYSRVTSPERRQVERALSTIMSYWNEKINSKIELKPLTYNTDGQAIN